MDARVAMKPILGVLVDDLVTQGRVRAVSDVHQPRGISLSLREDNADMRLTEAGGRWAWWMTCVGMYSTESATLFHVKHSA